MKLGISEILSRASKITGDDQRVHFLRMHESPALKEILRYAYHPAIKWLLPEGNPPYKPNDLVDQHHRLYTDIRKLYLFVEGGNPNLKQHRREHLFIELLESVDPEDAKLLLAIKDKHIPYPGITINIINRAFPGLI